MGSKFDYVVVGAGNAAGYVARYFVELGVKPGQLAIVGAEEFAPYERPALSKGFLMGKAKLPGFHTCVGGGGERQEPQWYQDHGITLLTSTEITSADAKQRTLTTASGSQIIAEKALILATGSSSIRLTRNPGHDLKGVCGLRDVADGNIILSQLENTKSAVMVGGGYIGLECAAALASQGKEVTMVLPEKHVMERLFTEEIAAMYEAFYTSKGVKIVKGVFCNEFEGKDGALTGCKLSDGRVLPCEMAIVGVGAIPNTKLFDGQLDIAPKPMGGFVVDGSMQTSVPGVYAIGDVATFPLTRYDRQQRVEHVTCCRLTAQQVAKVLLDTTPPPAFDYLPFFYSRVFSLSWRFWGDSKGETVVVGGSLAGAGPCELVAVWIDGGKVSGVMVEGGGDAENAIAKQAATDRPAIDGAKLKACATVADALALLKA